MAALTVDFRKHSGPTPADDMAAQLITDCGNFTLDFKQHGFCASPLFLQTRLWDLDFQMKCKIYFHLKRGLGTTEQQSSSFSPQPGKMLLMLSLVQKWLGSLSWRRLSVVTPASVHSLWSSPKCLNQLCLTVFSSCGHPCCCAPFPTQILPSRQLCI